MPHPFTKLLEKALKKSNPDENWVLKEALRLKEKGYRPEEIYPLLVALRNSYIDDTYCEILDEAIEKFGDYTDDE